MGLSLLLVHRFARFFLCQSKDGTDASQGRWLLMLWKQGNDLWMESFDLDALNADLELRERCLCIQFDFGDGRDLWHCEQAFHMHRGAVLCRLKL